MPEADARAPMTDPMHEGTDSRRGPHRIRVSIGMTIHPDTIERFDRVCARFNLPRGQVVDKLLVALDTAVALGKLTCISGELCRMARTDVPPIL
jgi:hypothetical protein